MSKNKIVDVVFKKFQSYSFIIFLALVLGAFFALSQLNNNPEETPNNNVPTTGDNDQDPNPNVPNNPVNNVEDEKFKLPMLASLNPVKVRDIWSMDANVEDQQKSLIFFETVIYENTGVNYSVDKETAFEVRASLSGEVIKAQESDTLGYIVEIEHLYGVTTVYSSFSEINVAVGDQVDQGDVIGTASDNMFDTESGVHVHFEVYQNGKLLNPNELIGIKISELEED